MLILLSGEVESKGEDRYRGEGFDGSSASTEEKPLGSRELAASGTVPGNAEMLNAGEALAAGDEPDARQSHKVSEDDDDVDRAGGTESELPDAGDIPLGGDPPEALPSKVPASLAFAAGDRANGSPQSGNTVPFNAHDPSPAI